MTTEPDHPYAPDGGVDITVLLRCLVQLVDDVQPVLQEVADLARQALAERAT